MQQVLLPCGRGVRWQELTTAQVDAIELAVAQSAGGDEGLAALTIKSIELGSKRMVRAYTKESGLSGGEIANRRVKDAEKELQNTILKGAAPGAPRYTEKQKALEDAKRELAEAERVALSGATWVDVTPDFYEETPEGEAKWKAILPMKDQRTLRGMYQRLHTVTAEEVDDLLGKASSVPTGA